MSVEYSVAVTMTVKNTPAALKMCREVEERLKCDGMVDVSVTPEAILLDLDVGGTFGCGGVAYVEERLRKLARVSSHPILMTGSYEGTPFTEWIGGTKKSRAAAVSSDAVQEIAKLARRLTVDDRLSAVRAVSSRGGLDYPFPAKKKEKKRE